MAAQAAKPAIELITENNKRMLPLSAKTEVSLQASAKALLQHIEQNNVDLDALTWTLQAGREAMDERLGLMVASVDELKAKLTAFIEGRKESGMLRGQVRKNREGMSIISQDEDVKQAIINKWLGAGQLTKLMDLWVKGLSFDWAVLYGEQKPQRISLPTYVFAKERHWFDVESVLEMPKQDAIHPLLHKNTSSLAGQSYSSTFTGAEAFVQKQADGSKVLGGAAYLEMVRAAVTDAAPGDPAASNLTLCNLVWSEPVALDEQAIDIALFANGNEQVDFDIYSQNGAEQAVHCQGQVLIGAAQPQQMLDLQDIHDHLCSVDAAEGFEAVYQGQDQVLAEIEVAGAARHNHYQLNPVVLNKALEAAALLLEQKATPVSLESLSLLAPCQDKMQVWARRNGELMDVDLLDMDGNVCAQLTGLQLEAVFEADDSQDWDGVSYVCRWEQAALKSSEQKAHQNVLVVCAGSTSGFDKTIADFYSQNPQGNLRTVQLADTTKQVDDSHWQCGYHDEQGYQSCLEGMGKIDALYFLALEDDSKPFDSQQTPELQLLRLVKTLKGHNDNGQRIDTYVLTADNYVLGPVDEQSNRSWGAGASGLCYALAQGSYQFPVRNVDLCSAELAEEQGRIDVLSMLTREGAADRGEVFKYQGGQRWRHCFIKLNWGGAQDAPIQHGGLYVIVGGSGLVGQVFTRNLIERHDATVVWVGRSAETTDKMQEALKPFNKYNGKLNYVQADATDAGAMNEAMSQIKAKHGRINGALFASMVFGNENSVDQTTEADYLRIVEVKTHGSRVFFDSLKDEPLDFMCFFSSGQGYAFSGASKLSGYATGITWSDSYVRFHPV